MSNQEKNEVLLRWAGFRFNLSASENPHYWTYPDGEVVDRDSFRHLLPDFLNSLDAQEKWLWPKVNPISVRKHRTIAFEAGDPRIDEFKGFSRHLDTGEYEWWVADLGYHDGHIVGRAVDPAEACAEAILALIEGEK